jgi:DNA-binding HxlR family transcriptional regulator
MGYPRGMIAAADLVRISSSRWFMPLLATMSRDGGARFAALANQHGISRSALSRSLQGLIEAGWVARNPGHGHPLRPEYVLTDAGTPLAAWCERVMEQRRRLRLEPGQLPRWSLPLVARLRRNPARFSTLQSALAVTPRALSLTIRQMLSVELVSRSVEPAFPPTARYGLTGRGRRLAEAIGDAHPSP